MKNDHKKLLRLFIAGQPLAEGARLALAENHFHYLRNVMRRQEGDTLRVFNAEDGEFLATLTTLSKKTGEITVQSRLRAPHAVEDLWLAAAPLKKTAMEWMVEKACELGASALVPVITDHTVVHQWNAERLQAQSTEAAEQCERLHVMKVEEGVPLRQLFAQNPARKFLVCVERVEAMPLLEAALASKGHPRAVVIGPEGGFSAAEIEWLGSVPNVQPVSLGAQVLRAETAALAALAMVSLA